MVPADPGAARGGRATGDRVAYRIFFLITATAWFVKSPPIFTGIKSSWMPQVNVRLNRASRFA